MDIYWLPAQPAVHTVILILNEIPSAALHVLCGADRGGVPRDPSMMTSPPRQTQVSLSPAQLSMARWARPVEPGAWLAAFGNARNKSPLQPEPFLVPSVSARRHTVSGARSACSWCLGPRMRAVGGWSRDRRAVRSGCSGGGGEKSCTGADLGAVLWLLAGKRKIAVARTECRGVSVSCSDATPCLRTGNRGEERLHSLAAEGEESGHHEVRREDGLCTARHCLCQCPFISTDSSAPGRSVSP